MEPRSAVDPLVPEDFVVPPPPRTALFTFQVLGPQHNARDHRAWTGSIEHIRSTPGFAGRHWPRAIESLDQNLASLERHQHDFAQRRGFSYAVLDASDGAYLGCVYFYPPRTPGFDVDVRSWVTEERAELDEPLHDVVRRWLSQAWPWHRPDYAER